MIINKKDLGEDWPFTVDEVRVKIKRGAYILKYNYKRYAINGIAENCNTLPLEKSGIWLNNTWIIGAKKSLSPLMEFIMEKTK